MRSPEDQKLQDDADLSQVLATPAGKRFVWTLIGYEAGGSSTTYSGEQTHHSAFLEGRRSVGVELLQSVLRVSPADYVHMLRDALDARMKEQLEAERLAKERKNG